MMKYIGAYSTIYWKGGLKNELKDKVEELTNKLDQAMIIDISSYRADAVKKVGKKTYYGAWSRVKTSGKVK